MRKAYYLEDDLDTQSIMTCLLELELPSGYQIQAFRKLSDLKSALSADTPDLVISDLNVLDAGPKAVVEVLRQDVPTDVPVIVSSGDHAAVEALRSDRRFKVFPKGADLALLQRCLSDCSLSA